jgi:PPOX class probable F420-dependent enzyme
MSTADAVGCRASAHDALHQDQAMDPQRSERAALRIDRMLRSESVVWLSSVGSEGTPHLVPVWFSWDGSSLLIASKPHAKKVANLRANPSVMLAVGEPDDDFDVGMIEGVAELLDEPAAAVLPPAHLAKYRSQMTAIGLSTEEFLATYSQVIRVRPTRFLPWHGRTTPASESGLIPLDRRIGRAIRRVAATVHAQPSRHVAIGI